MNEAAEENWILFEGAFLVPANIGVPVLSKALPVALPYGKPMVLNTDGMSCKIVSHEEVTVMRVKQKVTE